MFKKLADNEKSRKITQDAKSYFNFLILRLLVQIHDELLLEVADEDLKQVTGNK